MMNCVIFWTCVLFAGLTIFLSSLPVWNLSLNLLASRYDESSSHPYLWVGRTHWAAQGQRQSEALTGIWGEWAQGSKVKVSSGYWFLSDCVVIVGDTRVSAFPEGKACFSSFYIYFFPLVANTVAGGAWAIMKYQLFSATYFLRYIGNLSLAKQDNCHFQLYKISLGGLFQLLNSPMQFPHIVG